MKDIDVVKKEMLSLKKWAVIGFTDDRSKYGYKIFNKLTKRDTQLMELILNMMK